MSRHHHRSVRAGSPHPPRVRRQRIPVRRRPFLVPWCSTSVSNLLLEPLYRRGQWYRSHHLFRDMLRAEPERVEPGLVLELRRREAGWCQRNDLPEDALEYSMAAGTSRRPPA